MKIARTLSVLLLVACGDQGTGGPLPLAKMRGELRKVLCEKVYSCCSASERMTNPLIGHDAASCQTELPAYATFLLSDFADSVVKGRAAYDGEKMARCLADLKAKSCTEIKMPVTGVDVEELCDDIIEPKVAIGGACSEYWDCIGGWCAGDAGGLMDRCTPLKADGGDCDEEPECGGGACALGVCAKHEPERGNLCKLGITGSER
jgi:hypothetical protein